MDNENKYQDFVDKYRDIDLKDCKEEYTNWENRTSTHSVSTITLRRYYKLLSNVNKGLLAALIVSVIAVILLSAKFLLFTEFEMIVFSDGTDVTCIFNPSTGEMKQNDK